MLSGALQRNAEHEARLSNISVKVRGIRLRNNRRLNSFVSRLTRRYPTRLGTPCRSPRLLPFFAPVRMTFMR